MEQDVQPTQGQWIRQPLSRDEALERLEKANRLSVKKVEHGPRTRVAVAESQPVFKTGSKSYPFSEEGLSRLDKFSRVPADLRKTLSTGTYTTVVNELLGKKQAYNLVLDQEEVVDIVPYGDRHRLPAEKVVNTVEKAVAPSTGLQFIRADVTSGRNARLEISTEKEMAVQKDDIVRAGLCVFFSTIGAISPQIRSYAVRQWCLNGATTEDVIESYAFSGGGGNGEVWKWFRRNSREAIKALSAIVNRWHQMMSDEIPPEDRAAMLEALLKEAGINGEAANAVRAEAMGTPPKNAYDLHNLVTWAGTHLLESPEQAEKAQRRADRYSQEESHSRICPTCRRGVRGHRVIDSTLSTN